MFRDTMQNNGPAAVRKQPCRGKHPLMCGGTSGVAISSVRKQPCQEKCPLMSGGTSGVALSYTIIKPHGWKQPSRSCSCTFLKVGKKLCASKAYGHLCASATNALICDLCCLLVTIRGWSACRRVALSVFRVTTRQQYKPAAHGLACA